MGFGVIWIVIYRGLSLGDGLRPLPLGEEYTCLRHMRGRIVRLGDHGSLGPILCARDVAFRIDAMVERSPDYQSPREADHRRDKLGVEFERALEKTHGGRPPLPWRAGAP